MSLQEILDFLRERPGFLEGVESELFSYRGSPDVCAIASAPQADMTTTNFLSSIEGQIDRGVPLAGWLGGEFPIDLSKGLYIVEMRGYTGKQVTDILMNNNAAYEFLTEEQ